MRRSTDERRGQTVEDAECSAGDRREREHQWITASAADQQRSGCCDDRGDGNPALTETVQPEERRGGRSVEAQEECGTEQAKLARAEAAIILGDSENQRQQVVEDRTDGSEHEGRSNDSAAVRIAGRRARDGAWDSAGSIAAHDRDDPRLVSAAGTLRQPAASVNDISDRLDDIFAHVPVLSSPDTSVMSRVRNVIKLARRDS